MSGADEDGQVVGDEGATARMQEQQAGTEAIIPDLKLGDAWGDSITNDRAATLEQRLQAWEQEADHGNRKGPFDRLGLSDVERERFNLTGADVFWLAARALAGTSRVWAVAGQMDELRHARHDFLFRLTPGLSTLHLAGADLVGANLARAVLYLANLENVNLAYADLSKADLERTNLAGADLEQAILVGASLAGANLAGADLVHADLSRGRLPRANLSGARLEGVNLSGASLGNATFDHTTNLTMAQVTDTLGRFTALGRWLRRQPTYGPVSVADLKWNGADLTVVDWSGLRKLGDERGRRRRWHSREEAERATRANIQLSKQLDNAGLKDDSDRFAYRAQVCQRSVHLRRFQLGRWLFSWLLFILAGYGYRPLRTLFWYLAVIGSFAFAYFQATHGGLTFGLPPSQIQPLPWYEALVLSVSSFHGRGFFQPVQSLGDPVAILAAIEAVFGLFIEVSFIATFTQRYFGK